MAELTVGKVIWRQPARQAIEPVTLPKRAEVSATARHDRDGPLPAPSD